MSTDLIHQLYAGLLPWLGLSLLLLGRSPILSRLRIVGSLLLAFFLLRIPVHGWNIFLWIRSLEANPSIIMSGLLSVALWQRVSGREIFRLSDWTAAWIFGSAAAFTIYPMGLGLTSVDSYCWGWDRGLPVATAAIATALLLLGNRFGILLLLPSAGFFLDLQESRNFWDALVDPIYAVISLGAVILLLLRLCTQRQQRVASFDKGQTAC